MDAGRLGRMKESPNSAGQHPNRVKLSQELWGGFEGGQGVNRVPM